MTAAELARELEVSERTVNRDVLALSEAGIPVYADRGRTGGYRLLDGYRTRLTGLSRAEAEALFLSGAPGPLQEMGLTEAVATAQLKVLAALPASLRDTSTRSAQRFHLEAPWWTRATTPPETLTALTQAVWGDRSVHADYRRGAEEVERELEPYGLVWKGGTWYVVARARDVDDTADAGGRPALDPQGPDPQACHRQALAGSLRVYRVDRFTRIDPSQTRFERDESFDLAAFWNERALEFARSILTIELRLRLSPVGVRKLRWMMDPVAADDAEFGEPDADGWVPATVRAESEQVAYTQLLGFGPDAEVLEPETLRKQVVAAARRTTELYDGAG